MPKSKLRRMLGDEKWLEYQRLRANEKADAWKSRNGTKVVAWRQRLKKRLIAYKGGKCEICGYNKDIPAVYCFHHIDPVQKEFSIAAGGLCVSYEKCIAEVDKCRLLCNNCHSEEHFRLQEEKNAENERAWLEKSRHYKEKIEALIESVPGAIKARVNRPPRPKKARPSDDELRTILQGKETRVSFAKRHGVAESTVRSWIGKIK